MSQFEAFGIGFGDDGGGAFKRVFGGGDVLRGIDVRSGEFFKGDVGVGGVHDRLGERF